MNIDCTNNQAVSQSVIDLVDDPIPRINLSTSEDIRREMAKVYRETRANKILPSNGTKLVYMLTNILKAYESTQIEKRLSELELMHLGEGR
jgi:predicted nucleic acid-binding protein